MHRLEAAAARGAEIVVIDPRRTETVDRTGARWVPLRPGTDGALALSMIEVMIDEELYDEPFAESWCHGFDELRAYVQHFRPEVAEHITGVPAETIRDLARRICHATGACPVMYTGLEYSNSGVQAIRAVLTLFALAGQLDVPGGIGLAMRDSHFPINRSGNQENPAPVRAVGRDRFPIYSAYRGESHAGSLVRSVLEGEPYRIRGLLIQGASLITSRPQPALWRETLSRLDFQVCIDRQLTADAAYADIVLPATTMFEIDSYMVYGPIFRLREKLIEPVGEARSDYLIMAELARRLGYADRYPQTEEAAIRAALEGSGYSLEDVRAAVGSVKIPAPFMEYKKWEKGGLRADCRPGFDTPTAKFEIWSTTLEEQGYEPLPKYSEPLEGPIARPDLMQQFPLVFNSGARPQTDFRSQHHGLAKDNPEPTVELNEDDARARGIAGGDLVEVRTPRGAVPFRARVTDAIVPGAIECNMGGGTPVGSKAWQAWNVNELTDFDNYDEISGFPVYKALLCDVVRLEGGTEAAVRDAVLPYLEANYGNPSSIHGTGRSAREGVETARRRVAGLIHARPRRIIFTGSGTEANNLALQGAAQALHDQGTHIVTSTVEHPAILETCRALERRGYSVTYCAVDEHGQVQPHVLRDALRDDTVLVSIMMANNEVGTVQPLAELCAVAHERGALFHTDAVQAVGKIPVDVEALGIDLLSLSGHKFHAPKGVGALYVTKGVELEPIIHGGKQEGGLRAGTENVAAIVGLGRAAELAQQRLREPDGMTRLRDQLETGIRALVPGAHLNGHPQQRLPNTLNLTLPGLRGESLVVALDQQGISLSSGSACKSGSPEPTHVLMAMGLEEEAAHCALRLSLSHETTAEEIDATLAALARVLEEMETTVRFLPCK